MNRQHSISLMAFVTLAALCLVGCKAGTASSPQQVQESYFIEVTEHAIFDNSDHLKAELSKRMSRDNVVEGNDLKTVTWPMRLLLVKGPAQQLAHNDLGSPPMLLSSDPIGVLINVGYLLGWSVNEAGKAAINAASSDNIIRMRLHILDSKGSLWRINDEIGVDELDNEDDQQVAAREIADIIAEYLETFRAGETVENAVKETSTYELKRMRGEMK